MSEYKPVTVEAAVSIAERFDKSQVLIIAYDTAHQKTHFTTYGVTPEDKESIARVGDYLGQHLTGIEREQCTNYEDYRFIDQGKRAAENRSLRSVLKRLYKVAEHGRPADPRDGDKWDRAMEAAEKCLSALELSE